MLKVYTKTGVAFQYPGNWTLDEEDDGESWAVTVNSPGTAFFIVSLRPDNQTPAQVVDVTLDALKAEYKELDAEPVTETISGYPAVGYDIDFLTIDTSITAWSRCVSLAEGNLLVIGQVSEFDRRMYEDVLKAMLGSFTIADGDE